mmetsp:Transcript_1772/g.2396  ORF Transcript_1772/g.2396 Transcript_1772/m.2396 type:complete len:96 (-) Transcript_1772:738-1025(-)
MRSEEAVDNRSAYPCQNEAPGKHQRNKTRTNQNCSDPERNNALFPCHNDLDEPEDLAYLTDIPLVTSKLSEKVQWYPGRNNCLDCVVTDSLEFFL